MFLKKELLFINFNRFLLSQEFQKLVIGNHKLPTKKLLKLLHIQFLKPHYQ
jgi:hypothetical protein